MREERLRCVALRGDTWRECVASHVRDACKSSGRMCEECCQEGRADGAGKARREMVPRTVHRLDARPTGHGHGRTDGWAALLDTRGNARGEVIASRVERNAKGMPRYMGQESAAKNEGQTEEGKSEARDGATDSPSLGRAPQGGHILHRGDDTRRWMGSDTRGNARGEIIGSRVKGCMCESECIRV